MFVRARSAALGVLCAQYDAYTTHTCIGTCLLEEGLVRACHTSQLMFVDYDVCTMFVRACSAALGMLRAQYGAHTTHTCIGTSA